MIENLADASDDRLMMRFKDGDVRAFEVLYDRYESQLFGLCRRLLPSWDEAEDVLQDAFVKVIDRRDAFEPQGRFRSWIFTIVRFTCMDRLRVANTERKAFARLDASKSVEPAENVSLARVDVDRMLRSLPVDQREILVLHSLYGFNYAEIATITESTEAGVRQKAYRAVRALRAPTSSGRIAE